MKKHNKDFEEPNQKNTNNGKSPKFPFDKMPYQEKGENENDIHEYDIESDQELNLGENPERNKKRTLRDEKGAGHEP